MRGEWSEGQNQNDQNAGSCKRVCQQRNGAIAARKLLGHDAGADDSGQQKQSAKGFRRQSPGQVRPHRVVSAISFKEFWMAPGVSRSIGNARNAVIRLSSSS